MKYVLFLRDNIAVAKARVSDIGNVDASAYDVIEDITEDVFNSIALPAEEIAEDGSNSIELTTEEIEEIAEDIFNSIALPAEKIDGVWTKTDKFPSFKYPAQDNEQDNQQCGEQVTWDALAAAYEEGVNEA